MLAPACDSPLINSLLALLSGEPTADQLTLTPTGRCAAGPTCAFGALGGLAAALEAEDGAAG